MPLIEPYGIEMSHSYTNSYKGHHPLIEPYGIEM